LMRVRPFPRYLAGRPLESIVCRLDGSLTRPSVQTPDARSALTGARGTWGASGATGSFLSSDRGRSMSAFVGRPWGRDVEGRTYRRRLKNGKWERIRSHLRRWPGDTGALYFVY